MKKYFSKGGVIFTLMLNITAMRSTAQVPVLYNNAAVLTNSASGGLTGSGATGGSTGGTSGGSQLLPVVPDFITPGSTPAATAQWHFAGQHAGAINQDWLYGMVVTDKKEVIGVGFNYIDGDGSHYQGNIIKLDHTGKLKWNTIIEIATSAGYNITVYDYTFTASLSSYSEHTTRSDLWAVAKAGDGYIAVGKGNLGTGATAQSLLIVVEVDENGNFINGTPIGIVPPNSPYQSDEPASYWDANPMVAPYAFGYSVAVDPTTNSAQNIVVGAVVGDKLGGTGYKGAGIMVLNYESGAWNLAYSYYGGNGGSSFNKLLTKSNGASSYDIYACGGISAVGATDDNTAIVYPINALGDTVSLTTYDKDIWLLHLGYNKTTPTSTTNASDYYNKANIYVSNGFTSSYIDGDYTNTGIYPYQEVGPLSARNYETTSGNVYWWDFTTLSYQNTSPASAYLNATVNVNEVGVDMTFTNDNNIAVVAMVNIIGNNSKWDYGYTAGGIILTGDNSAATGFDEYVDGDAFLLKIDPTQIGNNTNEGTFSINTSLLGAKNVGHFSAPDFFLQVRQDPENNYIIAGSTADHYTTTSSETNIIDVLSVADEGDSYALIVGASDDFSSGGTDLWRRTYIASDVHAQAEICGVCSGTVTATTDENSNDEDCMCLFGLDITADGGFVICGNNGNNNDDWTVTKFAPQNQNLRKGKTAAEGGYYQFVAGGVPSVYTLSGDETWSPGVAGMNIASQIIVPAGFTLTLNAGNYNFASSSNIWDYNQAPLPYTGYGIGCGIIVQQGAGLVAGGSLVINAGATLQGISIAGEHAMWDGIVVLGDNTADATAQGNVTLNSDALVGGATIQDARYGIYFADNYRTYNDGGVVSTFSLGTSTSYPVSGCTYSSRYNGYGSAGGGSVTADKTNFTDCRFGVNFQNGTNTATRTFTNCTFASSAAGMGDVCFYTTANGGLVAANTHYAAWATAGMEIYGNMFSCSNTFTTDIRPVGLICAASGMNLNQYNNGIYDYSTGTYCCSTIAIPGNTFSNLSYGVIAGDPPGVTYPIKINYNTFTDNGFGIEAGGLINNLIIGNNIIYVPNGGLSTYSTAYNTYGYTAGITLAGCDGYSVSYNRLLASTTIPGLPILHTHGIIVNDATPNNNKIDRNEFDNLYYATIAAGNNGDDGAGTGLQLHCNNYLADLSCITRDRYFYFDATSPHPAIVKPQQGYCSGALADPTTPANNQFNSSCIGGNSFLHDDDAAITQPVTYNYNPTTTVPQFSPGSCFTSLFTSHGCTGLSGSSISEACPADYHIIELPIDALTGSDYLAQMLSNLGALATAIADPNNADSITQSYLIAQQDMLLNQIAQYYNYQADYADAAALYISYDKYRSALPYYMMEADYIDAQTTHDNIPLVTAEDSLYYTLSQIAINLYSNGHTWFDLDTTTVATLRNQSQYNLAAGYMAGAINALIGTGSITFPIPLLDTSFADSLLNNDPNNQNIGLRKGNFKQSAITNTNSDASFIVFPNPSYGQFTSVSSINGQFEVYSIEGRLIGKYNVLSGNTAIELPNTLASGIYMGIFRPSNGSKTSTIRLVIKP